MARTKSRPDLLGGGLLATAPPTGACGRFFAIQEMLLHFLNLLPTISLVKVQRVCRLWNALIQRSPTLQNHLFRVTDDDYPKVLKHDNSSESSESGGTEGESSEKIKPPKPIWNPVLTQCFGPILTSLDGQDSDWCAYEDMGALPWAQDGQTLTATAREAYARPEASWRNMLVSKPPIRRLDWWHAWSTEVTERDETSGIEEPEHAGWGHQDRTDFITIGMLWDLVEARLFRGCYARVVYFAEGKLPATDPTATDEEKRWATELADDSRFHGWISTLPRIKILTRQSWDHAPLAGEKFDNETRRWITIPGELSAVQGNYDGFNLLREDCKSEYHRERSSSSRWSRSDGFRWAELNGESSGGW